MWESEARTMEVAFLDCTEFTGINDTLLSKSYKFGAPPGLEAVYSRAEVCVCR